VSARKKTSLGEGLGEGLSRIRPSELGRGLGEGLVRFSEIWLPGGKFAVPQTCPVAGCGAGPYPSKPAMYHHLSGSHASLSIREFSYLLDQAQRAAVRQAMNGTPRVP